MKQKRTFITLLLIIALLCLGIAYAAIDGVHLEISGNVSATASDSNFNVEFTGEPLKTGDGTITATASGTNGTINVSGLTTKDQTATVTYTIKNSSPTNLKANLTKSLDYDKTDWFEVTADLADTSIEKEGTTTLTVTVKLKKTPITTADEEDATDTITINIDAEADQPVV